MSSLLDQFKLALPGRYEIERLLGSGGMATVYLARDRQYNRRVAIKVLRAELAGAVGQDRFLREIQIASELNHPHILPLLDSGTAGINGDTLPFYVMPFVEGESLRDRLNREKQLPIDETIAIARDVAAALQHAHAHRIIHRDIKPENILLTGHEAVVADFGIARAIDRSADKDVLTTIGVAIGTAAYMSPEQASAQAELDGRTDVYSLGCVVYEMLGGDPPFTGSSANAVAARHRVDTVPPLRTIRPSVPPHVEAAVLRALEKIPADRFNTAEQFAAALSHRPSITAPTPAGLFPSQNRVRLNIVLAAMLIVVMGTSWVIWRVAGGRPGGEGPVLDTTRYAIIPAQRDTTGSTGLNPAMLLQDAMARWSGITLVDPIQVRDALARRGSLKGGDWRQVATDLGAGRFVRVDATPMGDSIRVQAVLYDTGKETQLADQVAHVVAGFVGSSATYSNLAASLLFRDERHGTPMDSMIGTSSAPARQAFAKGQEALADWNLPAADSAFDAASRYDPQYSEAYLWLAMSRAWAGQDLTSWQSAAERAAASTDRLSERDRTVAAAILARSRHDAGRACQIWKQLSASEPHDFIAWYGLADCQSADEVVVRDPRSPSNWRFRSSYHSALQAYQRAFQLLPSIHRALGAGSFESVRRLFKTTGSDLRLGRALAPDTGGFAAYPTWQGDSLAFVPFLYQDIGKAYEQSTTHRQAIVHQRELFRRVASAWAAAYPRSPGALEAVAISLEMLGDPSALDTLRQARSMATTATDRNRIAAAEVWLLVKTTIPSNQEGLQVARRLADSLLETPATGTSLPFMTLAGLAALTGRANLAARLSRNRSFLGEWTISRVLVDDAPALLMFAALGGPVDSLRSLERRVASIIDHSVPEEDRQQERTAWLNRAAALAFPAYSFASVRTSGSGDAFLDGIGRMNAGDSASIRLEMSKLRKVRRSVEPTDRSFDALLPEASVLAALGDRQEAVEWLDPTLDALAGTGLGVLADPIQAGALMRSIVLRADLAEQEGDKEGAARWGAVVVTLWSAADSFLQPVVQRMRGYVH